MRAPAYRPNHVFLYPMSEPELPLRNLGAKLGHLVVVGPNEVEPVNANRTGLDQIWTTKHQLALNSLRTRDDLRSGLDFAHLNLTSNAYVTRETFAGPPGVSAGATTESSHDPFHSSRSRTPPLTHPCRVPAFAMSLTTSHTFPRIPIEVKTPRYPCDGHTLHKMICLLTVLH